jgi:threonine dehydrogenase-like Zn-dependent dehydrogenase
VWSTWQRTVQLLREKKVNTEALISHELALEDFQEAFRATQTGEAIKVILNPALGQKGIVRERRT